MDHVKGFPFKVKVTRDYVRRTVERALREDISRGDVTTRLVVSPTRRATAALLLKDDGVVAGFAAFSAAFAGVDPRVKVAFKADQGMWCERGTAVATVAGRAASILTAERVALNFVQRLSGVATATRRFVEAVSGTGVKILDTRKTTPNLRLLEKEAVCLGGGFNHRPDLASLVLIKDNHIRSVGSIARAVSLARRGATGLPIEVEVSPEVDLDEIADLDVDLLMFDNWPLAPLRRAIRRSRGFRSRPLIEVSGRVRLDNVRAVALAGPDFISVGYITHSAAALDLSLDLRSRESKGTLNCRTSRRKSY